jgi:hypothetical protein
LAKTRAGKDQGMQRTGIATDSSIHLLQFDENDDATRPVIGYPDKSRPPGEPIMREAQVWRMKAADLRRMAQTSKEVERERKLLQLAAMLEAQADAVEPPAEGRPRP